MGFGDELMVTGRVRQMQEADPRRRKVRLICRRWNEVFDHNPRIAHGTDADRDVQTLHTREGGLRPYCVAKDLHRRWLWCEYSPPVGELFFQRDEQQFSRSLPELDVVIEPNLKGNASPNKDWGWERWAALIDLLRRAGREPVQLGREGTRVLPGARLIVTRNFRWACAALSRARSAIVTEGGLHHAAAVVGVPAVVVIYGGFISPRVTGYEGQTALFEGDDLGCGWRLPCEHCAGAMARITPERVLSAWEGTL